MTEKMINKRLKNDKNGITNYINDKKKNDNTNDNTNDKKTALQTI